MSVDFLLLVGCVGFTTWAFRYLPIALSKQGHSNSGKMEPFFQSIGPAAIAALFTASVLPGAGFIPTDMILASLGVIAVYGWKKSVVLATMTGSFVYGGLTFFQNLGG